MPESACFFQHLQHIINLPSNLRLFPGMSNNSLYLFVTVRQPIGLRNELSRSVLATDGTVGIAAGTADKEENFNQTTDQQDPEEKKN